MNDAFSAAIDRVCSEQSWVRTGDRIEVPIEGGRRQTLLLDAYDFEGEELVRVVSPIGPSTHIDPLHLNTALRLNYGLPHGALALNGDQIVLVDTLIADDPDTEEIEVVFDYLAETADHFEKTIFGTDEV